MTVDEKNIVWLDLFPFLTYHKKLKILESFKAGEDIRSKFRSNPILNTILAEEEYNKMCALLDPSYLDNAIQKFTRDNIIIITKYDPRYPELLKEIPNAPFVFIAWVTFFENSSLSTANACPAGTRQE